MVELDDGVGVVAGSLPSSSVAIDGCGVGVAVVVFLVGDVAGVGVGCDGLGVLPFGSGDLLGLGVGLKISPGSKMGAIGCV